MIARRILLAVGLWLLAAGACAQAAGTGLPAGRFVPWVANVGQWTTPQRYEAQVGDGALFAERGALTVVLRTPIAHPMTEKDGEVRYHAYRMTFVGSRIVEPRGEGLQEDYHNYFVGSDAGQWRGRVPLYGQLRYEGLYDGIDLVVAATAGGGKYTFEVAPGADAGQIVVDYEGAEEVKVTKEGHLRVRTSVGDVEEMAPVVYQTDGASRQTVESRWKVTAAERGHYRARIETGHYDRNRELVVDPSLVFSTYTGSTADNWGTTSTYDSKRNVYSAGVVFGIGYPTSTGAYQTTFGGLTDIGIFKFDSTGSQRLYATYVGGSLTDMPHSMTVNSFDELILMGTTGSSDFPVTADAYQTTHAGGANINYISGLMAYPQGSDLFVCRMSEDGSQLAASTYVGGSGNDGLNYRQNLNYDFRYMYGNDSLYMNYGDAARGEVATDQLNNVYVGSTTFSSNFPVSAGCVQPTLGGRQDGVVLKLDHNLRNLLWSTYLGGFMDDAVYSVDVDSNYNLLVCGGTSSTNFPTTAGTLQNVYGGGSADGFVCKISYGGEQLMASTYMGTSGYDQLYFVRNGKHDEVFLYGQTEPAGNTMIQNAAYSVYNSGMLLARLDPTLALQRWSTVFGTPGRINLSPTAFTVDICNRVYAAGWGRDFVGYGSTTWNTLGTTGMETTADAYQDITDGQDFYVMCLGGDGGELVHATFFGELHQNALDAGSDHVDGGTSRIDRLGTLYQAVCASCGGANGFPVTSNAWSTQNLASNCNNAIFSYNIADDFPVAEYLLPPSGCAPHTVHFHNTGRGEAFEWDFGDGTTSTEASPTHTYTSPGNYTVRLVASLPGGCSVTDTLRHTIQVLGDTAYSHPVESACNGTKIQIGVRPSPGVEYQWTGDEVSDATVANPWVDQTGTYVLHTSAEGCSQTDTFHVKSINLISMQHLTPISCHDSADGQLRLMLHADMPPDSLTIAVEPAATVSDTTMPNGSHWVFIDGLQANTLYHISAAAMGCTFERTLQLGNPPLPPLQKEATHSLCSDSCSGHIRLTYQQGTGTSATEVDTLLSDLCPGTYVTRVVSAGCPVVDTTVIVRDHSLDSLIATADRYEIYLGESVHLKAEGVSQQVAYSWTPAADLDHPDSQHPTATPQDTLSCYTVTATTPSGCSASDTVCIRCTPLRCGDPLFTIPNAFTPNGDGINDRICFESDIIEEFSISIFNRWGQCVFSSQQLGDCWDGTYDGRPCLQGVYTYTCHLRCVNHEESQMKGDITLIR